jgi:DNA-binding winged helix-turn-helix (wHTH) protein/Tol biopolymer transport system component
VTVAKSFVFRFGEFEIREREYLLVRAGESTPVEPKAFRVLLSLLRNPGRLVTKDEIAQAVWNDCSVSDNSLTRSIATLRRLLRDDAREPRYIATVQTVGYRFLCEVQVLEELAGSEGGNKGPPSGESESRIAQGSLHSVSTSVHGSLGRFETSAQWLEDTEISRKPATVVSMPSPPLPPPDTTAEPEPKRAYWIWVFRAAAVVLAAVLSWLLVGNRKLIWPAMGIALHRPAVSNGHAFKQRRLTANPEEAPVTSAVISPDGKYLAYSDSTGLYLKLVDSGETHPLPLPANFTPAVESWFPDSVHLAVSWVENASKPPGLWTISILGGSPRKLTDVGSFARVSPDGAKIAFSRGPWDDNEIWLMDSDGNGARKLVDGGLDYFGPVGWSPDGQRFAAVRGSVERPESQIQVYDPQTGRPENMLSLAGLGPDLLWAAPGKLLYTRIEAPPNQDNSNIWEVEFDQRTGHPSGSVRVTDDRDCVGSMTASSNGKRLAITRYSHQGDVYLTTIDENSRRLTAPRRFTLDQRNDFPSSWTPDSKTVLVVSDRDGVNHIFKQKSDQAQPELFVGGKQNVWLPHMTPDGASVLYLTGSDQVGPSDKVQLLSVPLEGGPSRPVLEQPGIVNYQCARLPSRVCVYGSVEPEDYKFYAFDPSNGNRRQLPIRMKKGSAMNNWNLSPDGRYLAISETQNPYDGPRMRLISLADQTERMLSPSELKLIVGVDWAADSKSIWLGGFMGRGSWTARTGLINVDLNGHSRVAIETRSPGIMGGTPSPDGRSLALGTNSLSSNVWLLESP